MITGFWEYRPSQSRSNKLTREAFRLGSTAARLKLKGIDGDPHKRWNMWFNSTVSEEPHQGLTCSCKVPKGIRLRGCYTGAAWLSSARAVRCTLKWGNERNPYAVLLFHSRLPRITGRKAGMTSNQHGSYVLGDTRATMDGTTGRQSESWS
jgi:hypothetical protein